MAAGVSTTTTPLFIGASFVILMSAFTDNLSNLDSMVYIAATTILCQVKETKVYRD